MKVNNMKCPSCGEELTLYGGVTYHCFNEKCDVFVVTIKDLETYTNHRKKLAVIDKEILEKSREKRRYKI